MLPSISTSLSMLRRFAAFLRRPAAAPLAAVRCVSSGSVEITVPLNFWAGKRRTSQEKCNKENVYEPATGKSYGSVDIRKYFPFFSDDVSLLDFTHCCLKVDCVVTCAQAFFKLP